MALRAVDNFSFIKNNPVVCVLGVGDGELHEAEDPGGKQQVHQTLALLHHHLLLDNF